MRALARASGMTMRSRLMLTVACGLLALLGQASLAYRSVVANRAAADAVAHTRDVIGLADEALTSLIDTQADYRGYLLTGDATFVARITADERTLDTRLAALGPLTADNPAQVARWQQIAVDVAAWRQSTVEPAVVMRQQSAGAIPIQSVALLTDGQSRVNTIRDVFADASGVEQTLMVGRSRTAEAANALLLQVLVFGSLGTAAIALGLVLFMARARRLELARVNTAALAIAAGDFDRRVGRVGTAEIAQTAAAVDQMANAMKHDVERLRAIIVAQSEIAQAELQPAVLFDRITQRAQALTGAAGALVEMPSDDEMVCHAASGSANVYLGVRLPRDGSLSGLCIQTGRTLKCDDALYDARVNTDACRRIGVRSLVVTPLASEGTIIGVLKVVSLKASAFSGRDVDTLHLVAGLLGAALDRAHAFRAKERSEAIFRAVSESAHEAIVSADAGGHIVFWNPAAASLFGYAPNDLLGVSFEALLPAVLAPDDPLHPQDAVRQSIGQRADGSHVPVELSLARWEAEGQAYTTAIVRDITERQLVERLKDELISVVSHELRTPLTSMRAALGLLAAGLLRSTPDTAQRMLQIAVENTDRLTRLVNDFLDLEHLQSGRLEPDLAPCTTVELIEQATDSVRGVALAAGVDVIADPTPTELAVDADRIIQVLTNLLSNAIKFSPAGETVRIWSETDGHQVVFGVRDAGRGIPADKLKAIFERFRQLDPSDTRQSGGTGLGLTISRSIVELHGGRITVESTLGEGSTFRVFLPDGTLFRSESKKNGQGR